jgi:hypothetical protein
MYQRRVGLGQGSTCTVSLMVQGLAGGRRGARGRHREPDGRLAWTLRLGEPAVVVDLVAAAEVDRFGAPGPDGYPVLGPAPSQVRACARLLPVLGGRAAALARRSLRVASGPPV